MVLRLGCAPLRLFHVHPQVDAGGNGGAKVDSSAVLKRIAECQQMATSNMLRFAVSLDGLGILNP